MVVEIHDFDATLGLWPIYLEIITMARKDAIAKLKTILMSRREALRKNLSTLTPFVPSLRWLACDLPEGSRLPPEGDPRSHCGHLVELEDRSGYPLLSKMGRKHQQAPLARKLVASEDAEALHPTVGGP